MPELPGHVLGQAIRVAQRDAVAHRALQRLLRRLARHVGLVRILVAEFAQAEPAAVGDLHRPPQRLGIVAEQPRHLGGALEVAVGEPLLAEACLVDGAAFADAGHHVLQDAAVRGVEQHVTGDDGRHARRLRQVVQPTQPHGVARTTAQGQGQVAATREACVETAELLLQAAVRLVGEQDDHQALPMGDQVQPRDVAAALACAALAQGQQPAQAPVCGTVRRVDEQRQAVAQGKAASHDEADADLLGTGVGAGYSGQGVMVGDGDGLEAHLLGLEQQLLDVAGAAQEGVVRGRLELDVVGHDPDLVADAGARCCRGRKALRDLHASLFQPSLTNLEVTVDEAGMVGAER